jgi:hypothetical protein
MLSEIAKLRKALETEAQSLAMFNQTHMVGGHGMVDAKYEAMGVLTNRLEEIIGAEEATTILCEIYNKSL